MANHKGMIDLEGARISAREMVMQRKTCEGCAMLRTYPRPMCAGEKSPHFRTVRDTYHERCPVYHVAGMQPAPPKPEPAPPPPAKKGRVKMVRLRGIDRVVTESEYDALLAQNAKRRVGA